MGTIHLQSATDPLCTSISNIFIDYYMPHANGSYVKVYLYLLRCLNSHLKDFSISFLADHLENTEADIIRALRYWEKVGLLQLIEDASHSISSITIMNPSVEQSFPISTQTVLSATQQPLIQPSSVQLPIQQTSTITTSSAVQSSIIQQPNVQLPITNGSAIQTVNDTTQLNSDVLPKNKTTYELPPKTSYTNTQLEELTNNDEVQWTMNIIEIYLERPLKPKDTELILYLYKTVGFSAELIMYVYEYCISKGKKHTSYIETVALSWAQQGISTVEQAEETNALFNTNYLAITKALGLNQNPRPIEKQYMDKWLHKYGFSIEIIVEACNRTLLNTQKADFHYLNGILENWHKKGVKCVDDIKHLDSEFNAIKSTKKISSSNSTNTNSSSSYTSKPLNHRFNAFPQRNYTKEDYANLEKRLLKRS